MTILILWLAYLLVFWVGVLFGIGFAIFLRTLRDEDLDPADPMEYNDPMPWMQDKR